MADVGTLASWTAVCFAAWAFIAGLTLRAAGHPARRSAERALIASAVAAAVAATALVQLLLVGDVTVNYVARSIATNLPSPYRVAALWNLPAGAVLPTAALVALAGWRASARAHSSLGVAATGAIVMALCAASLTASPFATLPWVPTDGVGLSPALQHPLSVVGRVALSMAIAAGGAFVARTAEAVADGRRDVERTQRAAAWAMVLFGVATWATAIGRFATGTADSPAPATALVPALVALMLAWQARGGDAAAHFQAALGSLGLMSVVLLAGETPGAKAWALTAFAVVSLGAAASGAAMAAMSTRSTAVRSLALIGIVLLTGAGGAARWFSGGASQWLGSAAQWLLIGGGVALSAAALIDDLAAGGARLWMSVLPVVLAVVLGVTMRPIVPPAVGWAVVAGLAVAVSLSRGLAGPALPDRRSRALLALSVALAALGAAGEDWARESTVTLASGAHATVPVRFGGSYTLTHQGISRFEDRNAHVQALALEPSRGGRQLALLSAERRAYVDSRDEVLGETVKRPATQRWGLESLRVRLDDVTADEGVRLRLTVVPFSLAWTASLVLLAAVALQLTVARVAPAAAPSSPESVPA